MTVPALMHVATPSMAITESALFNGYDGVLLDLQHGELGLEPACAILRSIPRGVAHRWVRVASVDSGAIGRLLDSGARGIVAPTVESADQARGLVAATKYPPLGCRSLGPSRPALYEGQDYTAAGNAAVSTVVQIETVAGLEAADEILAVPGLDAVYVGPADLAVSFGLAGRVDWEDGPVREAITDLSKRARHRGLTFGLYCGSAAYAAELVSEGLLDFLGLGIDLVFVGQQARTAIATLRSEL